MSGAGQGHVAAWGAGSEEGGRARLGAELGRVRGSLGATRASGMASGHALHLLCGFGRRRPLLQDQKLIGQKHKCRSYKQSNRETTKKNQWAHTF